MLAWWFLDCVWVFFFFSSRRRHTRCALVTGVQTCALPIYAGIESRCEIHVMDLVERRQLIRQRALFSERIVVHIGSGVGGKDAAGAQQQSGEIGRASCRERVCQYV